MVRVGFDKDTGEPTVNGRPVDDVDEAIDEYEAYEESNADMNSDR
jgi:hypothetical protein